MNEKEEMHWSIVMMEQPFLFPSTNQALFSLFLLTASLSVFITFR
jgi:hypothetical protein